MRRGLGSNSLGRTGSRAEVLGAGGGCGGGGGRTRGRAGLGWGIRRRYEGRYRGGGKGEHFRLTLAEEIATHPHTRTCCFPFTLSIYGRRILPPLEGR